MLAFIEEKCGAIKAVITCIFFCKSRAFDSSVDASLNNYVLDEMMDDIDIVVEEDGKSAKIRTDDLKVLH